MNENPMEPMQQPAYSEQLREAFGLWSRCFWALFWLSLLGNIPALMTDERVAGWLPALYWPGLLLKLALGIGSGAVMMRLAKAEPQFRSAGILQIAAGLIAFALSALSWHGQDGAWTLLLSLPGVLVGLYATYRLLSASANLVSPYDPKLSQNWQKLWRWYLYTIFGLTALLVLGITLLFLVGAAPLLILLLLLLGVLGIVMLVISILLLIYLYRTAKLFALLHGTQPA